MTQHGDMKEHDHGGRSMAKMHRSSSPEWMPEEGKNTNCDFYMSHNEELVSPPSTHVFLPPPQFWFGIDEEEEEEEEEEDENNGGGSGDHVTSALSSLGSLGSSSSSSSGYEKSGEEDSGEPLCFWGMEELKRQIGYESQGGGLRPAPTMPRKPCHWHHEN
eukprot:scaffold62754_cov33-Attheya_sp.AAC.2